MEDRQTRVLKKLAKVSGIDEAKLMDAFSKIDKEEPIEQPNQTKTDKVDDKLTEPNETPNVEDGKAKVDENIKTETANPTNVETEPLVNETPIDGMTKRIASLEEALKASEAKTAQLYEMFNKLDVGNKTTETTDFDTRKLGGAPIETRKGGDGENNDDIVKKLGGYADR